MDKAKVYEEIVKIGDATYKGHKNWKKDRLPSGTPRVFWNLFNLRSKDLIVAIEGTTVCGICELKHHGIDGYSYDEKYDYAHEFGGEVNWVDWEENTFGVPPTPPRLSVKGIARLSNQAHAVIETWDKIYSS